MKQLVLNAVNVCLYFFASLLHHIILSPAASLAVPNFFHVNL
jgi:hypothetical protein